MIQMRIMGIVAYSFLSGGKKNRVKICVTRYQTPSSAKFAKSMLHPPSSTRRLDAASLEVPLLWLSQIKSFKG